MVPVQFLETSAAADANVTAVLGAITTYAGTYVSAVTSWFTAFVPQVLPIAGIGLSFYFGLRILKRVAKG